MIAIDVVLKNGHSFKNKVAVFNLFFIKCIIKWYVE